MGRAMATADEINMRARIRRQVIYNRKQSTGKTDRELAKEFGVSVSQINHLCRRVRNELEGRNFKEERNERIFQIHLRKLIPITEQIKGLTKDEQQG
jgi:transposase